MSARTQQHQIAHAMAAQLDRVNGGGTQAQRLASLEAENAKLRMLLEKARQRIVTLEAQTTPDDEQPALPGSEDQPPPTLAYKGRPATTIQRAAQHYGVHASTIYRRLLPGSRNRLAGEQLPGSNRWIVYLDQPFGSFRRR